MKFFRIVMFLGVIVLTGCSATGPKLAELKSRGALPTLPEGLGRVYFFREDSVVGTAVRPAIYMDGVPVGNSIPGGFFFVDAVPGVHLVRTTTEVDRVLSVTLGQGETRYVRTSIGIGLFVGHVTPELVDPAVAQAVLSESSFTGTSTGQMASSLVAATPAPAATATAAITAQPAAASLAAAAVPVTRSGFAYIDPSAFSDACRKAYVNYLEHSPPSAFMVSVNGHCGWSFSQSLTSQYAFQSCEKYGGKGCHLYAEDGKVVGAESSARP